jgi:3-oxoadipate enol-lactonase
MDGLINSLKMHYQLDGQPRGAPIVFINSLGCNLHIWDQVTPAFTDRFRIIRYDKRGHGLSEAPPGPYSLRDHTKDLASLLSYLGVNEAVLTGISIGGLIAMDYALLNPSHARALILCDTAPKIGTVETWNERIAAVSQQGLEAMAEKIAGRWFVPSFPQEHPLEYRRSVEMLSRSSTGGYIATCATLRDADLTSSMRAIHAPTLAVCGVEDPVVSPEQTREWASCLPDARVLIIDRAAHLPCIEQPEELAKSMDQFLKEAGYGG